MRILFPLLILILLLNNGCDGFGPVTQKELNELKKQKHIVVLALENPLVYKVGKNNEGYGIDYDLLTAFAQNYHLNLDWKTFSSKEKMLEQLEQGNGDIAVGRLNADSNIMNQFIIPTSFEETDLSLFCRKNLDINDFDDLSGRKVIVFNSDDQNHLIQKKLNLKTQLWLNGTVSRAFTEIARKESDCVIAETIEGIFWTQRYLTVKKIIPLGRKYSIGWAVHQDNNTLALVIKKWSATARRTGEVEKIIDRYNMRLKQLDDQDIRLFLKNVSQVLPVYEKDFIKAAKANQIPWQLLAAVAYQESHWRPEAKSYTGVLGMMQLTLETAEAMGIEDRRDPLQSIQGGARYLKFLWDKMPKDLNRKEALALVLAAYNIGYGHLVDAQKLAELIGKNPYSWKDLKTVLPLLENENFFSKTEFGHARGNETVQFVEKTKSYYQWLVMRE